MFALPKILPPDPAGTSGPVPLPLSVSLRKEANLGHRVMVSVLLTTPHHFSATQPADSVALLLTDPASPRK